MAGRHGGNGQACQQEQEVEGSHLQAACRLPGHTSPSKATFPKPSKGSLGSLGSGAQINEPLGDFSYLNTPKSQATVGPRLK